MNPHALAIGSRVEVRVRQLSDTGEALGQLASATGTEPEVRMFGLLPGERARVRVTHLARGRRRVYAEVEEVLEPAAARREAPCRHQGRCGGCPLMIAEPALQCDLKRDRLTRLGLQIRDVVADEQHELGYRWSCKRVVGGRPGRLRFGSYRRGSHQLANMEGCLVDHPDIVACLDELRHAADELGVVPYDEQRRTGDLRYLWLKTNGAGEVLVTLISASPHSRAVELARRLERPAGVAWALQDATGNALRGADANALVGVSSLDVVMAGETTRMGPLGFLQPNPRIASLAYRDLVDGPNPSEAPAGALAWDLYAGAGITTALLRRRFGRVVPCEAYPESAAALGVAPCSSEDFLRAQRRAAAAELVVANPPRAGLGQTVCASLNQLALRAPGMRLHLMSCEPRALAADSARLENTFELLGVQAYDTLPQTPHLELVAWLRAR